MIKYVAFLLLLVGACKSSKKETVVAPAAPGTAIVELQTHGCRGFCPQYRLRFMDNGVVEYEGLRNMQKTGMATFNLNPSELARLKVETDKVNLWQYPERIPSTVADAPMSTLTAFKKDGTKHEVTGSIDRPKVLLDYEKMLKSMAESNGFVLKGVDPNVPAPNARQEELLVKLTPDANIGNWLMQFSEIKLRIIRRVSADNVWLVAYNPDEIPGKDLIDLLKKTKEVVDAQPNQKAGDRN